MAKYSFNFRLDKRRKLDNGKYPIKVNLYSSELKRNYDFSIPDTKISDGSLVEASCTPDDFDKIWVNRIKRNNFNEPVGETTVYGDRLNIRTVLKIKENILNDIISDVTISNYKDVRKRFKNYTPPKQFTSDVYEAFQQFIETKTSKTSKVYLSTLSAIQKFSNGLSLSIYDIDTNWLREFEHHRRKQGLKTSSIGIDMRNIRAVFNSQQKLNSGLSAVYPFGVGKYEIPKGGSRNASLDKEQLQRIKDFKTDNHYLQMARDYFLFSFYARGMNLKDIALLKKGQKDYVREKTKTTTKNEVVIKIKYNEEQMNIISRHKGRGSYLFDIIDDKDDDATITKKVGNKISSLAKQIKKLASELDLPPEMSFIWARHSYTTTVYKSGVNTKAISESLGHTSFSTTEGYIDSLIDESEDDINRAIEL